MWQMYPETFFADYSRLESTLFTRTRLQELYAVVVGVGALGNEVARTLGLLGAGRVCVVDPDSVEPSNLPRSTFFCRGNAIGRNKAAVLAEAAARLFPDTAWSAIGTEIADVGFRKLHNATLLFGCVDSDLARLEIAYISTKLRIPVADGALGQPNYSHGRVTFSPGTDGHACYACMLTPRKRRELLECWQATLRPCVPRLPDAYSVSTPTMASIIAAMQVEIGLHSVFAAQSGVSCGCFSVELDIHPTHRISEFKVPVSSDCPFHQSAGSLHAMPSENTTFQELLDHTASDALLLDWPICTHAKCVACERTWSPMQRLAVLRRKGQCPACHSRQILEQQIIRSIGRGSAWLHHTPSTLQLPAEHLYSVQRGNTIV